ncbi:MAG: metallophosphoesterase [Clostridia bacterium]|nr:metallophosphoesterase [Clostridia bacterium]
MTKTKKRLLIILTSVLLILAIIIALIAWGNKALMVNEITVNSDKLPEDFIGFKIAHVSDLHNDEFGDGNYKLISLIEKCDPDIIAITGDIFDCHRTDVDVAIEFAQKAAQIAPCYYVPGNHEQRVPEAYDELLKAFDEMGVIVLDNKAVKLNRGEHSINILGVSDPGFETDYLFGDTESVLRSHLNELMTDKESFNLLLSHRPELFDAYADFDVDLVLTGHAHGGQFRLPFVGGLYAPNQWFFPEYDAGLYTEDNTNMIVSRGLGNSLFPFRIGNRPEVVLVTLEN